MNFTTMLADQDSIQQKLYDVRDLTIPQREAWSKEYVQQLIAETSEVLNEFNWQHHKQPDKEVHRGRLLDELVDCQKFLTNLFYVWGYTAEEIEAAWAQKTFVVRQRLKTQQLGLPLRLPTDDIQSQALAQLRYELSETKAELAEANRNLNVLQNEIEALR